MSNVSKNMCQMCKADGAEKEPEVGCTDEYDLELHFHW